MIRRKHPANIRVLTFNVRRALMCKKITYHRKNIHIQQVFAQYTFSSIIIASAMMGGGGGGPC